MYRKIHLFDALGHRESDSVAPGDEVVIATVGGLRVGFMTCYDVRFPELARALAAGGAELLVLPAAWAAGTFKEEHWVTLVRARAIENTIWLAAAGQVPDPAERATHAPTGIGRSMLVDPMGVVRLDLGPAEGLGIGDVDTEQTASVRAALPCLANRRQDVLARLAAAARRPRPELVRLADAQCASLLRPAGDGAVTANRPDGHRDDHRDADRDGEAGSNSARDHGVSRSG